MRSLQGKRVLFTGKLASMSRKAAWQVVREAGGEPQQDLTRRTELLVVGMEGWSLLPDGSVSGSSPILRRILHPGVLLDRGQISLDLRERQPRFHLEPPNQRQARIFKMGGEVRLGSARDEAHKL